MYDIQPPTSVSSSKINVANQKYDPVGKPVKHKAADKQVCYVNFIWRNKKPIIKIYQLI